MGPIPDTKLTFFPYLEPPIGGEILISLNEKDYSSLSGVRYTYVGFVPDAYLEPLVTSALPPTLR
jgi:hypothetical protein